ncbi:glycosyltransferase family 39 protein [Nocardia blacklockiae]|uniref:glycosyltransferase family 39 protein n=1 Tax=Nocardia blacklockiae TaxID=480036 RepID=UPI001894811F|nr:glycosyltransferase family 39 protein [Nocardia blacklockiae]MBF6169910.1 glycosyltransferase family 39 protein [Nocardia blacklockiae]
MIVGSDVRDARVVRAAPVPPFAWREVGAVAVVAAAVFTARLGRYGLGGDELYFLAAGHHPSFGYADQGPVVPLLAAAADLLAPNSAVALRLPAVLLTVAAIVCSAALAREFGGGRRAQVLAAAAYATTPMAVMQSAMLSTFAVDVTLTAGITWLWIRWVRTRADRLLIVAGVLAAVDFQVKWLIPIVWAGLAFGVAVAGPHEMLRRRAWWAATALPVVTAIPNLLWQHAHGWPQLAMGQVVREEQVASSGVAGMPSQIVQVTGPLGLLLLAGMWAGLRWERLRPYRFVIPMVALGLVGVVGGALRPYFVAGAFPGLFAAGAVYLTERELSRRVRVLGLALLALATAISVAVVVALPLPASRLHTPTDSYSQIDRRSKLFGSSGWDRLTATVEAAFRALPPEQRRDAVLVTQNYWQAAALEHFGDPELPRVYSPNRGYGYFGPPPDTAATVLYVGVDGPEDALRTRFGQVSAVARLDDRLGFPSVDRGVTVWHCRFPGEPWSRTWPAARTLRMVDGTVR